VLATTARDSSNVLPEPRRDAPFSFLYPVLDWVSDDPGSCRADLASLASAGCRLVQLRAKQLDAGAFLDWVKLAVGDSERLGVKILVNDRADVALLSGAHGVHVGQEDLSPGAARSILGDEAIIGLSTHSVEEAERARDEPVDYVAIGPVFETRTKKSAYTPLGVDGVAAVRQVVTKPLVAIGGIDLKRARSLWNVGVDGVAVISALRTGEGSLEQRARAWLSMK
jgi:thiamine-phosphate pyrophosphorylase